MEKGIDIHNYDKLLVSTLRRMKESNISEKNKKIIEKFGKEEVFKALKKIRSAKYKPSIGLINKVVEEVRAKKKGKRK